MQTAEIKLEIFRYIDSLDTTKLIQVYDFLIKKKVTKKDFWDELNEWQKHDIELGLQDLEQGKKYDFDLVMQKYK
jgi:hypothetical protein